MAPPSLVRWVGFSSWALRWDGMKRSPARQCHSEGGLGSSKPGDGRLAGTALPRFLLQGVLGVPGS